MLSGAGEGQAARRKVGDATPEEAALVLKEDLDRNHPHAALSCGTCSERDVGGQEHEDVEESADEGSSGNELEDE